MSVLRLIIVDDKGEQVELSLRVEHKDMRADEYRVGTRARELYRDYLLRIGKWREPTPKTESEKRDHTSRMTDWALEQAGRGKA